MSQEIKHIPRSIQDNISYLYYFYRYLIKEQSKELIVIGTTNFLLGLMPILLVFLFEVSGLDDIKQRQFFGDGSMIIFCFGVLVSYVSLNLSSFTSKSSTEQKNISNNKILLYSFSLIYYLISFKLFEIAQINFERTWCFIYWVNGISVIFLIIAFLIVIYVKFCDKYDYSVISPYKDKVIADCKAKKALKKKDKKSSKQHGNEKLDL